MTAARNTIELEIGQIVAGRYGLLRPLGRGGGGSVWLAEDLQRARRMVAFKCVLPSDHDARQWTLMTESLEQEFRVLTRLRYPHLTRVFDIGVVESGGRYMTEEFIDGHTLEELIGRLSAEHTELICAQLLGALDYLDRKSVVHRDIKPGNIMVRWRLSPHDERHLVPHVKLLDFGLALNQQTDGPGLQGGTHPYMAPERLLGRDADTISELYSLAATIYHAVVGHLPHNLENKDPIALLSLPPVSFESFPDEVPRSVCGVLRRMLSVSRQGRYPDAREALEDLIFRSEGRLGDDLLNTFQGGMDGEGVLVGRHELISSLLARYQGGEAGRWMLVGPAGMGKRRLAREIEIQVQLMGRPTFRVEVPPGCTPYFVPAQVLELFGSLKASRARTTTLPAVGLMPRRRSIFSAINRSFEPMMLKKLSELDELDEAPVIIIEDLDLADDWSVKILSGWMANSSGVSLVATGQSVPAPLRQVCEQIEVRSMNVVEVQRFLEEIFGQVEVSRAILQKLVRLSGGSPAHLQTICKRLLDRNLIRPRRGDLWRVLGVPEEIAADNEGLSSYSRELGEDAYYVLCALSLMQRAVSLAFIELILQEQRGQEVSPRVTIVDPIYVMRLLESLDQRGLLHFDKHLEHPQVRPPGQRIQKLAAAEMSATQRTALHSAIGRVLGAQWRRSTWIKTREVAYHLQRGQRPEEARSWEMVAAVEALKVGAAQRAAEHLDWAMRSRPRGLSRAYLRWCQGSLALRSGDRAAAQAGFSEASQVAKESYVGALATADLVRLALLRGEVPRAHEFLSSLQRRWPALKGTFLVQRLIGLTAQRELSYHAAVAAFERCHQVARAAGWKAGQWDARLEQASSLLAMGETEQAQQALERLRGKIPGREMKLAGQVRALLGWVHFIRGDLELAHELVSKGLGALQEVGENQLEIEAQLVLSAVEFELGRPEQMLQRVARSMELISTRTGRGERMIFSGLHHLGRSLQGHEPKQALDVVRAITVEAYKSGEPLKISRAELMQAWGNWLCGRAEQARDCAANALKAAQNVPTGHHMMGRYAERLLSQTFV